MRKNIEIEKLCQWSPSGIEKTLHGEFLRIEFKWSFKSPFKSPHTLSQGRGRQKIQFEEKL